MVQEFCGDLARRPALKGMLSIESGPTLADSLPIDVITSQVQTGFVRLNNVSCAALHCIFRACEATMSSSRSGDVNRHDDFHFCA